MRYCRGYLESSAVLRREVKGFADHETTLRNGNVITTLAADYRSLRGRTLLCALLDEAAFLRSETSATPDFETARALLPGLATTGGMLVNLSSPYRRTGLLFERHRAYFGKDDDDVLVVAGPSEVFNPTLDRACHCAGSGGGSGCGARGMGWGCSATIFRRSCLTN
jgi:hypothetical protein